MPLEPGTRCGPYQILAPIGAGGMGEVYKARDTRLDRTVAVKVLPSHIAEREELRARFEREARVVSALNHPNICTLHDIGSQDDIDFLVMEFLEGETLADRLARGPLPLDQVLRYAAQIADAVDRAHRSGIVHRDLKPGNIMLTRDGAKVLDFGLARTAQAKAVAAAGVTVTQPITSQGTILGTPQYMAPEQIDGREADARSDVFAFGAVLYEMVTGKRAFDGKTWGSIVAAILNSEPPAMRSLQPIAPQALEKVVARCMAKDPEDRYQSLRDAALDLRTAASPPPSTIPKPTWTAWIVAASSLIVAATALALWLQRPDPAVPAFEFAIGANGAMRPHVVAFPAISPDGRNLVFEAYTSSTDRSLWLRPIDSLDGRPLPGTNRGNLPFWSPDSKSVAYFAEGKLWRTEIAGGVPRELCNIPFGAIGGGAWSPSGVIIFGAGAGQGLFQIPAQGGTPKTLTAVNTSRLELAHRFPSFLPDGRRFLYTVQGGNAESSGLFMSALDNPSQATRVLPAVVNAVLVPPAGKRPALLVSTRQQSLVAQKVDPQSLQVDGEPVPLVQEVGATQFGQAAFSFSANGILAFRKGRSNGVRLAWLDRTGARTVLPFPADAYGYPRLAPDGKRLVIRRGEIGSNWDLWMFDFGRSVFSRLTFDSGAESYPVWSPDGNHIVFVGNHEGSSELYRMNVNGAGNSQRLTREPGVKATLDWSRDGRFVLYRNTARPGGELRVLDLDSGKTTPALHATMAASSGRFSPDGKWIAYASNDAGRIEIYVQAFPGPGRKWQVTASGGTHPCWSSDSRQIFFISDDGVASAPVRLGSGEIEIGTPRTVTSYTAPAGLLYPYDVSPDNKRFLVLESADGNAPGDLIVKSNWYPGANP